MKTFLSHSPEWAKPRAGRQSGWGTLQQLMRTAVGLLVMATAPGSALAGDGHAAFFSEPVSGRKVTHYSIELPIRQGQRETFTIPDDCAVVLRATDEGSADRGSIVDRRYWQKVENDCRYHVFLYRHPMSEIEDHVSGYDFMNAKLSDMPIDRDCVTSGTAGCTVGPGDAFGVLRYFPLAEPASAAPEDGECIPCELRNGVFRGRLYVDADGIRCQTDANNAASLRLIAVDFADINGDHVLDAVLRFIPIGPGLNRTPLVLPLTRLEASAPFTVPEPAPLPPAPSQ